MHLRQLSSPYLDLGTASEDHHARSYRFCQATFRPNTLTHFCWYLSKARQCLFYLHLVRLLCCTALGALVWPSAMLLVHLVHLMSCRGFYAHVVVIPAQLLQCTLSVQLVQLVKYRWYTWHCSSWCIDIWLVHLM